MTRRIFIDTEWTAPPWDAACELLWVGLADEAGRSWYGLSAEVSIDPATHPFTAGLHRFIEPDGPPPMPRAQLAAQVQVFCGEQVDEFWAWVPPLDRFAAWFKLGADEASGLHARHWHVDLQMLQGLVQPWPAGWPQGLQNLEAAATAAGVEIPPRAGNHLHPRVHAEWNRELFGRIQAQR